MPISFPSRCPFPCLLFFPSRRSHLSHHRPAAYMNSRPSSCRCWWSQDQAASERCLTPKKVRRKSSAVPDNHPGSPPTVQPNLILSPVSPRSRTACGWLRVEKPSSLSICVCVGKMLGRGLEVRMGWILSYCNGQDFGSRRRQAGRLWFDKMLGGREGRVVILSG